MNDSEADLRAEIDNLYAAFGTMASAVSAVQSALIPLVCRAELADGILDVHAERVGMEQKLRASFDALQGAIALLKDQGNVRNSERLLQILRILKAAHAPKRILRDKDGRIEGWVTED